MYFETWAEFITMGGHGVYVWSSYGIAILILIYNLVVPVIAHRQAMHQIHRLEHRASHSIRYQVAATSITEESGPVEVMNEPDS